MRFIEEIVENGGLIGVSRCELPPEFDAVRIR